MQLEQKKLLSDHMHRIKGQLEAVEKMIEADSPCLDAVQQIKAIRSSLASVERRLISGELSDCLPAENKSDSINKLLDRLIE